MKHYFSVALIISLFLSGIFSAEAEVYKVKGSTTTKQKKTTSAKSTRKFESSRRRTKVPSKRRSSRSRRTYYGSTYQVPQFRIQVNQNLPILHFYPADRYVAVGGKPFSTLVILSNPKGITFDSVFIAVRYDPAILAPLEYEDKLPQDLLKKTPRMFVYQKEGVITYSAQLLQPIMLVDGELLTIKWRALLPQANSPLKFVTFDETPTGLYSEGTNILGEYQTDNDGTIPATITVMPHDYELSQEEENYLNKLVVDDVERQNEGGDGSVQLTLSAQESPVKAGETFLVDIFFKNPNAIQIDNVSLEIHFDPDVLKVVDYDEDNWITRDVNICDGAYHDTFPFDYHIKNRAYNQSGRIIYKMGISRGDILIHQGKLATIKFQALVPVRSTVIKFYRPPRSRYLKGAVLTYAGYDVLGSPDDRDAGLTNAVVAILP